ncbi:MAG: polyphosphate kinase 1 [Treponema sp.]|jgi:polyphosphate kinase|nr:polyphosphate kinase 1 [Treponema sp.]
MRKNYFNRELSWIDFNERVLNEGLRVDMPALERFRFLSIVSSNFDEFFMVRIAPLKAALQAERLANPQAEHSPETKADISGMKYEAILKACGEKTRSILKRLYDCLLNEIFPTLAANGLELLHPNGYSVDDAAFLETMFKREIAPALTPLRLDDRPLIGNKWLYAAFLLDPAYKIDKIRKTASCVSAPRDAPADVASEDGSYPRISVIKIPSFDRIVWLPVDKTGSLERKSTGAPEKSEKKRFALLEDMILCFAHHLYPGFQIKGRMLFKINRDADFSVDEKRDEDFIEAMNEALENRETSSPVRMVYTPGNEAVKEKIADFLGFEEHDLYEVPGPLQVSDLLVLVKAPGFDALKEKSWKIYRHPAFIADRQFADRQRESSSYTGCPGGVWDIIKAGDVLLHLPYQSFDPVVDFFQTAANDPQTLAIKTTLYRTSGNSPVLRALEQAALNGKQVTAVVELKARFDEERNISWAQRLEKAGVIVVYGLSNLKIHAKASIVMRKENGRIERYIHLSTGNYNDKTAKLYEDLSLFTVNEEIVFDTGILFNMLTGYSIIQSMRRLSIAPVDLKHRFLSLIERETSRSSEEYPGKIIAKMNALADSDIIQALYRASQSGVVIKLNVRGVCLLVPGVPGVSENISVISVIDHYLEHSRIFYFANGGAEEIFLSSADWMPRNLERRVELMFPVLQEDVREEVFSILETYFKDNTHARRLNQDGSWTQVGAGTGKPFRAQTELLKKARRAASKPLVTRESFIVRRSPPDV